MIEWIVTSSVLILLVIILRVIIKGRVSPRLRYALWGLVLLRLVAPVSLWESSASVLNAARANSGYQLASTIPNHMQLDENGRWRTVAGPDDSFRMKPEGVVVWDEEQPRLYNAYGWVAVSDAEEAQTLREQGQKAVDNALLKQMVDAKRALHILWQVGVGLFLLFLAMVNGRFAFVLRRKRRPAGTYRGRNVYVVDGLPTPCLFGLLHPAIYLTQAVVEDETAKAHVLAHEYTHFRQGDHIWAVLRGVCLALHWYNPLVWLAAALSRRDCELSCDEGAVRLLGEASRADYGRTLVGLVARRTTPRDLACCATTMTGGKSALKERIALLVKHPRTTAWMACIVAAACVVFAACTFTGAAVEEPDADPPQAVPEEPDADPPQTEPQDPVEAPAAYGRNEDEIEGQIALALTDWVMTREETPEDCRINWVALDEWRIDLNSGDIQAVFGAEVMVQVSDRESSYWWAGNTMAAEDMTDDLYRDYDGWLVFWREGYAVLDSDQWSVQGVGTGGCRLDDIDGDLGLETEGRDYRRFHALPEDLPTELMDLDLPDGEQGEWLLLAQAPYSDIALYRRAWDTQHVYLRVTNQSFQVFDRDLSGMELLPTLDTVEGDADITVQVLYRRYEGTYFNGTSYESGIVAEQVFYSWDAAEKYWTERYVFTRPAQLTEDRPVLADLPTRLVTPGTLEAEADMWLIGELPEDNIALYYEQSSSKTWLRYGDAIQPVNGIVLWMYPLITLPELYFEDLDDDGARELIIISTETVSTGIAREVLSVYEWDGGSWSGQTFDADWLVNSFNSDLTYQFYDDGTAFIWNSFIEEDLLLDLSELWESGYWSSPPDVCGLYGQMVNYTWQDGQLTLTLGGELLDSSGYYLHGHTFDYICPVVYSTYNGIGSFDYFECWFGTMRSDFAAELEPPPALTDTWRDILVKTLNECDGSSDNCFAIYDVNGDGADELIVRWRPENGTSSSWGTSVYNANGEERFHGHGELTFYDNGVISEPWSHNQGPAAAIWPYDLYQCILPYYDNGYFRYSYVGSARARSDYVDGFEKVAYADLDGDGMVYYIGEDAYTEENPVDNDVYEAWRDQYLAGAKILPVRYWSLTEENISQ